MQEKARIAAAIEILDEVKEGRPADRAVSAWGRNNRFAGSKDRRTISAYVYDVLRNCWRLTAAAPHDTARGLMLAHVRSQIENENLAEDLQVLFDGEGHGPTFLSAEEKAWLAAPLPKLDDAAHYNLPPFLADMLKKQYGAELPAVLEGFEGRAPIDLRVNTLKTNRKEMLDATGGEALDLADTAIRVVVDVDQALLKDGLLEPQDVGSQYVANVVAAKPGDQVIDFCAGGGGKTLALAGMMNNKGQIYAYDANPQRMKSLKKRADRAKVRNVQIATDLKALQAEMTGRADKVLVDAPCSGSGAWRRNPETRWGLSNNRLKALNSLQAEILDEAAPLVKKGGTLVYVTCSFIAAENEGQTQAFLARNPDFELGEPAPVQLLPHLTDSDGFYIATFKRTKLSTA